MFHLQSAARYIQTLKYCQYLFFQARAHFFQHLFITNAMNVHERDIRVCHRSDFHFLYPYIRIFDVSADHGNIGLQRLCEPLARTAEGHLGARLLDGAFLSPCVLQISASSEPSAKISELPSINSEKACPSPFLLSLRPAGAFSRICWMA